jgi:hypothetical protein
MAAAVKAGANISAGVDHENYHQIVSPVSSKLRNSLATDLA